MHGEKVKRLAFDDMIGEVLGHLKDDANDEKDSLNDYDLAKDKP